MRVPPNLDKGRLAEAAFIYAACLQNWQIALPHLSVLPYDVAVRISKDTGWLSVQVKTCGTKRKRNKTARVDLRRTNNKKYKKGDCDAFFFFNPTTRKGWLIPWELLKGRCEITPSLPKYDDYRIL